MPTLSSRMGTLPPYPLAHIPQKKRELLARGVDLIDLGAGDADLAPPPAALEGMARALKEPAMHRYGFGLGHVPFREAASRYMQDRFGQRFDPLTEIVPLIGSKEGLAHLAFAYLNPGDVAIIPEPGYQAYVGGTLLALGEPYAVPLKAEHDFLVELDQVPADVLKRAKMVYVNYPNNPTAAIAPRAYLERLVARCRTLGLLLVYDNAYAELAFDGYVPPSIFEIEGARDCAIEFHSLSKTFNMTGWRCAWAVAAPPIAGALARIKSFTDTGPFMAIQAAGVAALDSWRTFVPLNVAVFQRRRDAAVAAFREAGFAVESPKASMYLWIPLPSGVASKEFADRLMDNEGVVVLPGSGFGAGGEGYFRISFIQTEARLAEAARRAGRVLAAFGAAV